MKKNYSQTLLKPTNSITSINKNSSIELPKPEPSSQKKTFTRKPAGGYLPLGRKKNINQSLKQIDSTMEQTQIPQLLSKSKKLKFISSRSQTSLTTSVISKSATSLSLIQSYNQNQIDTSYSKLLQDDSMIPQEKQKYSYERQMFRRKTMDNLKRLTLNRKKPSDESMQISIMISKIEREGQKGDEESKLEMSGLSDVNRSFCNGYKKITSGNFLQSSKNSSKQSLRKSNVSGNLMNKYNSKCRQCQVHQNQIQQLKDKNEKLQRTIQSKDLQITKINKILQQVEKKNKELEKKVKEIQKMDYQNKLKMLQEQYTLIQQQCNHTKQSYTKTLQQLKYKSIQNTTLKKYQTQCQSLQRKIQMLVTQRNQLRQRLSTLRTSQRSSHGYYPNSLGKNNKNQSSSRVHHSQKKIDIFSYTSRRQDRSNMDEFEEEEYRDDNDGFMTQQNGFRKKKQSVRHYDESSESQIISLSQQSSY